MSDLIARLESAAEGSRELDARVHENDHVSPNWERWLIRDELPFPRISEVVPHYTTSLDAALTLLEPAPEYAISMLYGVADVEVGLNTDEPTRVRRLDGNVILALVTAALKARGAP